MANLVSKVVNDKPFVICTLVLAAATFGLHSAAEALHLHFRKLPIDLKKPLDQLDMTALHPYRLVEASEISKELIDELGTDQYLQATFEDPTLEQGQPGRLVNLFVTYYTGDPDQVPHVPDVCYAGGGFVVQGRGKNLTLTIPDIGLKNDALPVRSLVFSNPRAFGSVRTVMYFFSVNGKLVATRDQARLQLADLTTKYAYFSKVEIALAGFDSARQSEATKAASRFLARVTPLLIRQHWPEKEALRSSK